jgi:uncharacterized protein (UPF0548 family)
MILLGKPNSDTIQKFVELQSKLEFTYSGIGTTAKQPPVGYTVDHTRIRLGLGEPAFETGKSALAGWRHFQLGWVEALPRETPIERDATVAVIARVMGIWWLNAARIVYVLDESGPLRRWGFAYGTLPDHAESGEERFMIEWDRTDDNVYYDILAFSRPRHVLARMGYPYVRRLQRRFARDSAATVVAAVAKSVAELGHN